jgi:hypothetical protein
MSSEGIKFIKPNFINDIYQNVIVRTFPLLQSSHKQLLLNYLVNLLNVIAISFNFDFNKSEVYEHQFKQNRYQDLVALLLLLLPFINDDLNTKKQAITSLNDIFVAKINKNVDINGGEPKYLYSNLQYGRCIRKRDEITERGYNREYLDHNYYLLLDTIRSVSNKLYVNWVDILPYDILSFKTRKIYIDTLDKFETGNLSVWNPTIESELTENVANKLSGLCMDDIYDTIFNELYLNIKKIKWIIYDVVPSYPTTEPIPMLIACRYLFDLSAIVSGYKWDTITDEGRERFTGEWREFTNLLAGGNNYISDFIKLDNSALYKIGFGLLYAFDKGYKYKDDAIEKGEYIQFYKVSNADVDLDEVEDVGGISSDKVYSLVTLHPKHMYEYMRESIENFKRTWYYRYIFNQGTQFISEVDQYKDGVFASAEVTGRTITLTLKNIYNYSKSISHFAATREYKRGRFYPEFPKYWRSLTESQKGAVLDRLNNRVIPLHNWFNIMGYIQRTYTGTSLVPITNADLVSINSEIHDLIRSKLIQIIFESLITRGVLSYFHPFKEVTDESIIVGDEKVRKESIGNILRKTRLSKDNLYWKFSYYYLTGKPYSQIDLFNSDEGSNECGGSGGRGGEGSKGNKNTKKVDYFEYNISEHWFTFYAMNWISQIAFFQKYLNNRVMLVTGATGVGKSTQVPKLLLYALKAIDYKNNGSIACSQPRRPPTEKNAKTVSLQLGVPITDRVHYYVQYKHKLGSYTKNVNHLMLKFMTDKSLLLEIRNPLLKEARGSTKYMPNNLYDIVIVDEAHEHNKNMDLILTEMRHVTYYNNDIKLIIVSATMDDDEPVYRRYYRDINDNRMYPPNASIAENNLDRVNVDRRLHISPPGQTTKYKITEYYVPNENAIARINKIVTEDPTGFVLYFQPGIMEISGEIDKLNKVLPPDVIAIPFHSKLNDFQKCFVENIDDQLKNMRIDRRIPFSDFNQVTNSKGKSRYNRVVIVATNIAEASLTIRNLKYVIDTGVQKTAIYDFSKGGTTLIGKPISDSSRLQRKGRVGRTSSGTVYYLYSKGKTEGIKTQFDIAISDISPELYDMLYDSYASKPIFTARNDPNNLQFVRRPVSIDSLDDLYGDINGLPNIIENQYFAAENFYPYIGNMNHYDYQNSLNEFFTLQPVYTSWFSQDTLTDESGKFYIVHPEELNISRNIVGEIVGLKAGAENIKYGGKKIVSYKILSFWRILLENLFMSSYSYKGNTYTAKTDLGRGISTIKNELSAIGAEDFDTKLIYVLLYGMGFGIGEQVIRLISMHETTMGDFISNAISGSLVNGRYRNNIAKVAKFVGKQESDSHAILYILDGLHAILEANNILINQDTMVDDLVKLKYNFKNDPNSVDLNLRERLIDKIAKGEVQNSDKISNEDIVEMTRDHLSRDIIMNRLVGKSDLILQWANRTSMKYDTIMKYLYRYITFKNIIFTNEVQSKPYSDPKISKISSLVAILKGTIDDAVADKDKLTLSIMYGFKNQIIKKMVNNYYISAYEPTIERVYSLRKIAPTILSTLADRRSLQDYVLYFKENGEDNTISWLHKVNVDLLKYIGYVYSQDLMYNKCKWYLSTNIKMEVGLKQVNLQAASVYKKVVNEILYDIIGSHDVNIWYKLSSIFRDQQYLQIRRFHDINYMKVKQFSPFDEYQPVLFGGSVHDVGSICSHEHKIDIRLVKYLFKKFENSII